MTRRCGGKQALKDTAYDSCICTRATYLSAPVSIILCSMFYIVHDIILKVVSNPALLLSDRKDTHHSLSLILLND